MKTKGLEKIIAPLDTLKQKHEIKKFAKTLTPDTLYELEIDYESKWFDKLSARVIKDTTTKYIESHEYEKIIAMLDYIEPKQKYSIQAKEKAITKLADAYTKYDKIDDITKLLTKPYFKGEKGTKLKQKVVKKAVKKYDTYTGGFKLTRAIKNTLGELYWNAYIEKIESRLDTIRMAKIYAIYAGVTLGAIGGLILRGCK